MSDFIDTTILVAAIVGSERFHDPCRSLMVKAESSMYAHGVAETFSTLTGGGKAFRLTAAATSQLLEEHFIPLISLTQLSGLEMLRALREAESRGVRGGAVFDYLHLVAARKAKAAKFYTLNISHFRAFHKAGDPEIVHP